MSLMDIFHPAIGCSSHPLRSFKSLAFWVAVFTLSSSFPMISITLRNNLNTFIQLLSQKGTFQDFCYGLLSERLMLSHMDSTLYRRPLYRTPSKFRDVSNIFKIKCIVPWFPNKDGHIKDTTLRCLQTINTVPVLLVNSIGRAG